MRRAASTTPPPAKPAEPFGTYRATLIEGGITIRWVEYGQGIPVVLVHGMPTSPLVWRHVAPLLVNVKLFAWEMLGYGESMHEGHNRDLSVAKQADYLISWMKTIGLEKAVLGGHEVGGGVVQAVAAKEPSLCVALFLTNTICFDTWLSPSLLFFKRMGWLVKALPNAIFKKVFRTLLDKGHDTPEAAQQAFDTYWPQYERSGDAVEAFTKQAQSLDCSDTVQMHAALSQVHLPCRVVWGAADEAQKVQAGERLAAELNAPFYTMVAGRHFTPENHPEVVASEINALVDQVKLHVSYLTALPASLPASSSSSSLLTRLPPPPSRRAESSGRRSAGISPTALPGPGLERV